MKIVILIFLKHSHKLFFPLPMGISVGADPRAGQGRILLLSLRGAEAGECWRDRVRDTGLPPQTHALVAIPMSMPP